MQTAGASVLLTPADCTTGATTSTLPAPIVHNVSSKAETAVRIRLFCLISASFAEGEYRSRILATLTPINSNRTPRQDSNGGFEPIASIIV